MIEICTVQNFNSSFPLLRSDTNRNSLSFQLYKYQGCLHDRGTEDACTASGFGYGWRDPNSKSRSIMAYNCVSGQCDSALDINCNKVQVFSNPNTIVNGENIVDANNDNARQINNVRAEVAGYRAFVPTCTDNTECEDNDPYTTDICDGVCLNEPIECLVDTDCNDNNQCTNDLCDVNLSCANQVIPTTCCGNDICEPEEEVAGTCFLDCASGPFELVTDTCTSCAYYHGLMFDVEAKGLSNVIVTSLKTRIYTAGTVTAEVWTRPGTHVVSSGGWTKIAGEITCIFLSCNLAWFVLARNTSILIALTHICLSTLPPRAYLFKSLRHYHVTYPHVKLHASSKHRCR